MSTLKSFEELECWKSAVSLRKEVREVARLFPADEKYRLVDQIIRSSRSVPSNIAEGYGRFTFQENSRYCWIARGSLCETLDHLILAAEEGYITESQLADLRTKINNCLGILNGYINYLQSANRERAPKSNTLNKSDTKHTA